MANLLFLVHRLPYPPNKGDKVRSYHLLRHLVARHRVFLGTFVDDPDDETHVDTVRAMCAGSHIVRLSPARARLRSLGALWRGHPLTLDYYRDSGFAQWVDGILAREHIDAAIIFSSSMAQYVEHRVGLPMFVDFVDVDSAKWTQYAAMHRWPMSWLYRREGARLLAYERSIAARSTRAFFVTEKETALFRSLAPECAAACEPMGNGVDADYFAPDPARASPFAPGEKTVVFTGAMDYAPNVDAVAWFASEMLPRLRARWPALRFHIVGRSPTPAVRALAGEAVHVTGTVPDVRPYLQHAGVVVAPLRLARGIQNKVLEAMAMGRPVVAARECTDALTAQPGRELLAAATADDYVRAIDGLLAAPAHADAIGRGGRSRVLADYVWEAHLGAFERHLALVG